MKKFLITFLVCGITQTAFAADSGMELLENFSKKVVSAEGTFTQVVTDKNGKEIDNSSGNFVFSRPGKFIWEYTKPFPQYMVCNGNTIWIWDKDLNQVTERNAKEAIPQSPAAILFGSGNIKDYWEVKELGESDGIVRIQLTPKQGNMNFSQITMGFKGNIPAKIEFVGSLGETSKLDLNNVNVEKRFPTKLFDFVVPKGADVVKLE